MVVVGGRAIDLSFIRIAERASERANVMRPKDMRTENTIG